MKKSDIKRLKKLEQEKLKRIHQHIITQEELYLTALDYNEETVIIQSKIQEISDIGIIVIINPDQPKDGWGTTSTPRVFSLKNGHFYIERIRGGNIRTSRDN